MSSPTSTESPKQSKRAKKQQKKQHGTDTNPPNKPAKALLADTIGQALHERLLSFGDRYHQHQHQHPDQPSGQRHQNGWHQVDQQLLSTSPYLTVPQIPRSSTSSSSNISRKSSSMTLSSYDDRSVASSRTSHDSSPSPGISKSSSSYCTEQPQPSRIITLNPPCSMATIEHLISRHGQVSHMGVLDPSYSLFVNTTRTALLCFKVCNKVAIVSGDPMCAAEEYGSVLSEFQTWRQRQRLGIAFLGTSERMVDYAQRQHQHQHQHQPPQNENDTKSWTILEFGRERVLNPVTNPVLLEQEGKRIVLQNKQLLHPEKGGITLDVYIAPTPSSPSTATTTEDHLQFQLTEIYKTWRHHRNSTGTQTQAFITTPTPFTTPQTQTHPQIIYIYTTAPHTGTPNSLAALRYLGTQHGYHLDPCIAIPGSPKGLSDLLVFAAMALLRRLGCNYLSLGVEPYAQLGRVEGFASPLVEKLTRRAYRYAFARLPIQGKRAYFDKFRPDPTLERGLFLVFVGENSGHWLRRGRRGGEGKGKGKGAGGAPAVRQVVGVAHLANIRIRRVVWG
ncbi:hypothetical protein ASPACDRAFT_62346 [Aspergillus aculeatus ATCC 16872]|uniref:Phosphatidylglycerol lysyltransferase C-terminal domain-containing protein n=1 Tax=Aspergillus aculeatus (strain ATCC 16872 / CBS 172.66 / WB 5094) TaxID=690307 RepID=A0A1L9WPI1_ASPA1|nr:uncharacterized protein ASPACDRAFT_62346 [Aspergillus aculeatus ATCC 16872]OJJ98092.1 hypothetical protein ASPACDRAFT_62346 [Aspergillus aculeatus ATCC 16872]